MSTPGSPVETTLDAKGLRFAIVATRWNTAVVEQLLAGAQESLRDHFADNVRIYRCNGAFELAPLCARILRKGGIDGLIALGCLIRGGTDHYRLLADETTRALGLLAMEGAVNPRPVAVTFGVLTCESLAQAQERADAKGGNKGGEAAATCVEQARTLTAVDA